MVRPCVMLLSKNEKIWYMICQARERWLFVFVVGHFQYIDLPFELC